MEKTKEKNTTGNFEFLRSMDLGEIATENDLAQCTCGCVPKLHRILNRSGGYDSAVICPRCDEVLTYPAEEELLMVELWNHIHASNRYRLVNGDELAKFIMSKNFDDIYGFAAEYPEDSGPDEWNDSDVSNWYGICKTRIFDADVVMVGNYGGGYDVMGFSLESDGECLGGDLERYFDEWIMDGTTIKGLVCLDTAPQYPERN